MDISDIYCHSCELPKKLCYVYACYIANKYIMWAEWKVMATLHSSMQNGFGGTICISYSLKTVYRISQ